MKDAKLVVGIPEVDTKHLAAEGLDHLRRRCTHARVATHDERSLAVVAEAILHDTPLLVQHGCDRQPTRAYGRVTFRGDVPRAATTATRPPRRRSPQMRGGQGRSQAMAFVSRYCSNPSKAASLTRSRDARRYRRRSRLDEPPAQRRGTGGDLPLLARQPRRGRRPKSFVNIATAESGRAETGRSCS